MYDARDYAFELNIAKIILMHVSYAFELHNVIYMKLK